MARRRRLASTALSLAQLGHAHWFFGNLYEAVVRVPHRMLDEAVAADQATEVLRPGSPLRYYVPGIPLTVPAALVTLVAGWPDPRQRRWLAVFASCSATGGAITGYLVRRVNIPLFFSAEPVDAAQRVALLRTWYRLNGARLVVLTVGGLAAARARSVS